MDSAVAVSRSWLDSLSRHAGTGPTFLPVAMAQPEDSDVNRESGARDRILAAIRNANLPPGERDRRQADVSLNEGVNDRGEAIDRFERFARDEAATTERIANLSDVPAAIVRYLDAHELSRRICLAGNMRSVGIDWNATAALQCTDGPLAADGETVVTACYAGIAEAGAIVTLSSSDHPAEFNFLAATHIVVLRVRDIVVSFEQLWQRLRADHSERMPHMINLIVGPSRTADLGVPSRLGAHGPARVHIIVTGDG